MIAGHAVSAWRFRHFIFSSIRGELKGRFARSGLGAAWFILNPLAQATIYALVLSKVLGAKLGGVDNEAAYAIYLMAGVAAWGIFSEITTRCLTIFIEYGNTLKKISFPRIALPIIVFGGALINHALLLAAVVVVFAFFQHYPGPEWIAVPIGALVAAAFAFGLGLLTGVLNVFARDIGQVMSVVMQIWFWMTPIVYTVDVLPDGMKAVIEANPMTPVVRLYQDALLYHRWPDFGALLYPIGISLVLIAMAIIVFRRASPEIVDAL